VGAQAGAGGRVLLPQEEERHRRHTRGGGEAGRGAKDGRSVATTVYRIALTYIPLASLLSQDYAKDLYSRCKTYALDASEFCDNRFLTTALFGKGGVVATAGWTGVVKQWKYEPKAQIFKCEKEWDKGHEDR